MNNDILMMKLTFMSHDIEALANKLKLDGMTENKRSILYIENANANLKAAILDIERAAK